MLQNGNCCVSRNWTRHEKDKKSSILNAVRPNPTATIDAALQYFRARALCQRRGLRGDSGSFWLPAEQPIDDRIMAVQAKTPVISDQAFQSSPDAFAK